MRGSAAHPPVRPGEGGTPAPLVVRARRALREVGADVEEEVDAGFETDALVAGEEGTGGGGDEFLGVFSAVPVGLLLLRGESLLLPERLLLLLLLLLLALPLPWWRRLLLLLLLLPPPPPPPLLLLFALRLLSSLWPLPLDVLDVRLLRDVRPLAPLRDEMAALLERLLDRRSRARCARESCARASLLRRELARALRLE